MKITKLLLILSMFATGSALASGYPSTYPVWSDYRDNGSVHVQRDLQGSGAIALHIYYDGVLAKSRAVSVFVRIHYRDGSREALFPMERNGTGFYAVITNGCLKGQLGGCAEFGTLEMKHLLFWATRTPRTLNALDFEVALVNDQDRWDSQSGANYTFHFDEFH